MHPSTRRARVLLSIAIGCAGAPKQAPPPVAAPTLAPAAALRPPGPPEAPPLLQLPRDVHPVRYALSMRIVPTEERFSGTADIEVALDAPRSVLWLHGRGLHVTSARVDDASAAYEQVNAEGLARLVLARPVGPFDVVTPPPLPPNEVRSRLFQIRGIAPKGRGGELDFALKTGADLLVRLERYFGIEFPFEKLDHVAAPDYTYGAMENAGAILYREDILLFAPGVSAEQTRKSIASVMAHEMAHQWFGDLVTLRWWTDAWLNESFATWMGNRTVEEWNPAYGAWTSFLDGVDYAMGKDALASARAVRQPLDDIKNGWNQFDSITYQKGGGVLGRFERFPGPGRCGGGRLSYPRPQCSRGV